MYTTIKQLLCGKKHIKMLIIDPRNIELVATSSCILLCTAHGEYLTPPLACASEQGNVIGLVSVYIVYIYMCVCAYKKICNPAN